MVAPTPSFVGECTPVVRDRIERGPRPVDRRRELRSARHRDQRMAWRTREMEVGREGISWMGGDDVDVGCKGRNREALLLG